MFVGKVRKGVWADDLLVEYLGPEMFETQMKAKRMLKLALAHSVQATATATSTAQGEGALTRPRTIG